MFKRIAFSLTLIASLVIIYGFFQPWAKGTIGYPSYFKHEAGTVNGWDIVRHGVSLPHMTIKHSQSYFPLAALGGGVLILLVSLLGIVFANRFLGVPLMLGGLSSTLRLVRLKIIGMKPLVILLLLR